MKKKLLQQKPCSFLRLLHGYGCGVLLLCIAALTAPLSAHGQQRSETFSLKLDGVSVHAALEQINRVSGNNVTYRVEDVERETALVTVDLKNVTTLQAVVACLESTGLTATERNGRVVVTLRTTVRITGRVTDQNGDPMLGATVAARQGERVLGGTSTDVNGEYTLMLPAGTRIIMISYIGYKTTEVVIAGRNRIDVSLEEESANIEAVVVTGLFTRKAESYTGSAITFSQEDLRRVGNRNVFQSLKSLDPSLNIFTNMEMGSDPNTLPDMQMRGTSTFPTNETASSLKGNYRNNPNAPLFIVDGFEATLERVFDMDMNRIQSVTLLKDAAAKAIYGSKAANGVVVIETKTLLSDETRVSYIGSISLEMPDLTSYDLCDALDKLKVEQMEGFYERGKNPDEIIRLQRLYNERLAWARAGNSTYWLSKPLRTGISDRHTVSIEMGSERLRSIADFSYNNSQGAMKGSGRRTISGDVTLSYRYNKLLFKNIMNVSSVRENDSPYGEYSRYARLNPYWAPYDENGELVQYFTEPASGSKIGNPLYDASLETKLTGSYMTFVNNFYVEAELAEGLKGIASIGVSSKRLDDERFYPANHSRFLGYTFKEDLMRRGSYEMTHGKGSTIGGKFQLQYARTFDRHMIFVNAMYELHEDKFEEYIYTAEGFPSERMTNITFARQYAMGTTPLSIDGITRNFGLLGYLSYGFDDRYITDITYRKNGSSSFGHNNRGGGFWSVGLLWNIHNEKFMKGINGLNSLRLRASYGLTGNQNFAGNTSFALYKYNTQAQYNGFSGALLNNMENPDLAWEKKREFNYGFDLSYKGLDLHVDYYDGRTSDMVINMTIPASIGFKTVMDNLGAVDNTGWDIKLSYRILSGKNGFLSVGGGVVTNKNVISKLSDSMKEFNNRQMAIASQYNQSKPVLMYQEGMPIRAIWAMPSVGIDPQNGWEVYLNKDGQKTYNWSANDMVSYGSSDPKYNGTLNLSGEYKGFGLSLAATFFGGGKYYNYTLVDRVEDVDIFYNVDRRVLTGRWQTPGQQAQYTTLRKTTTIPEGGQVYVSTKMTSRFVQRRNELSLTSISGYYDFNQSFISKLRLRQLRLAVYLNDLATFSTIQIERGTAYPFARNLSFTLTATF